MKEQEIDPMYREVLLEHYKNPQNNGSMLAPDIHKEDSNPLCGDQIEIFVKLDGKDKIKDIKFKGKGCVISTASASILTEELKGKNISEIEKMTREDILDMLGINLTHTRIKCAMLPLMTIKKGIVEYRSKKENASSVNSLAANRKKTEMKNKSVKK